MPAPDLQVLDHTVQLTQDWIKELQERLGWSSSRDTLRLMRAVLTEIRDRIPQDEAARFSAQMPLLIRGMFFEGWQPARGPVTDRDAAAFRRAVEARLGRVERYDGDRDIRAVFATLANRIAEPELRQVRHALPRAIRGYWPPQLTWSDE